MVARSVRAACVPGNVRVVFLEVLDVFNFVTVDDQGDVRQEAIAIVASEKACRTRQNGGDQLTLLKIAAHLDGSRFSVLLVFDSIRTQFSRHRRAHARFGKAADAFEDLFRIGGFFEVRNEELHVLGSPLSLMTWDWQAKIPSCSLWISPSLVSSR